VKLQRRRSPKAKFMPSLASTAPRSTSRVLPSFFTIETRRCESLSVASSPFGPPCRDDRRERSASTSMRNGVVRRIDANSGMMIESTSP
jgi:hypothetical protein